jgi:hypothetical protein
MSHLIGYLTGFVLLMPCGEYCVPVGVLRGLVFFAGRALLGVIRRVTCRLNCQDMPCRP